MNRKVPTRFKTSDIPITEALQDAYDLSRDPVEDYAKQFSDTDEIHAEYNYELYRQFLDQCGLQYSLSRKQFDARFSRVIGKYGIIKHKTDIIVDRKRITTIYSKKLFLQ